jgi:feruloyl esterase
LTLPDTTITAVQSFMGGTFNAPDEGVYPNLPAFCRVTATLRPTSDSDINIEVWMPFSAWNGKFLGLGNGGFGGIFLYDSLARYLPLNYSIAQTDMGTSPGATQGFGVLTGHPEKQIDYATRSTNLMTVRAKQIIEAFYGDSPKYSYFVGCSGGGGSAVHEALQFPGDYDGIVAGAPFMNVTHRSAHDLWNFQAFNGPTIYYVGPGDGNHCCGGQAMRRQGWRFDLGQFPDRPAGLPLGSRCAAMHGWARRRAYLFDGATSRRGAKVLSRTDQPTHG